MKKSNKQMHIATETETSVFEPDPTPMIVSESSSVTYPIHTINTYTTIIPAQDTVDKETTKNLSEETDTFICEECGIKLEYTALRKNEYEEEMPYDFEFRVCPCCGKQVK